jgi:hypothetical protein
MSDDVIIHMTEEHVSIYLAGSTNRIFDSGLRKIHSSSINGLFTVHVSLFCVKWETSET